MPNSRPDSSMRILRQERPSNQVLYRQTPEKSTESPAVGKWTNLGIRDDEGGSKLVSEEHSVSVQPADRKTPSSCRQKASTGSRAQHQEASPSCVLKAVQESQDIRFRPTETRTYNKEYLIASVTHPDCPAYSTYCALKVN